MSNNKGNERKVRQGQRPFFSASMWNDVVDLIKKDKRTGVSEGTDTYSNELYPRSTVLVKNKIGSDLTSSFKVVRLTTPLVALTELHPANVRPAFECYNPLSDGDAFGITQEPIENNQIGKVAIAGITIAYVRMNDPNHEWCVPINGESGFLDSVDCSGQARILATAAGTGLPEDVKIAVINIIGAACQDPGVAPTDFHMLLGEVVSRSSNYHTVKRKTWSAGIVDYSPPTTITTYGISTTGSHIPVGTLVAVNPLPESGLGDMWITPVINAASGKPGIVSELDQEFSGVKTFENSIIVDSLGGEGASFYYPFVVFDYYANPDDGDSAGSMIRGSINTLATHAWDRRTISMLTADNGAGGLDSDPGKVLINGGIYFYAKTGTTVPNAVFYYDSTDELAYKTSGGTIRKVYTDYNGTLTLKNGSGANVELEFRDGHLLSFTEIEI